MAEIFLSASVPIVGRGTYHETADPFLIQKAVRELVVAVIHDHKIVWGGHPAITPMIWTICEDLDIAYSKSVVLYQSRYFEDRFPEENARFENVILVEAVQNDQAASLRRMREEMLSRRDLKAAVFIGGMEGVETEYEMFQYFHPAGKILLVPSPGGAARLLAEKLDSPDVSRLRDVDYARLYYTGLTQALDTDR